MDVRRRSRLSLQLVEEDDALSRARLENETLYAVIKTVSSSLDLDRVLHGIVDITTDATASHACFIYFVEGDRLVLRAASPRYARFVGELSLGIDEGLAGWVARNKTPEFIRENAMADPRMKFVPELEEEKFQSMVAVPILAKAGDVIGVVVLHTEAPREFEDDVLNFLVHTASLVAGAIENAQLYEDTRRRVQALTTLTQLSQALAEVTVREDLYEAVARGARELLRADACQIHRLDVDADELILVSSDPPNAPAPSPRPGGARLVLDLMRRAERQRAQRPAPPDRAAVARRRRPGGARRAPRGAQRAARGDLLPRPQSRVHRRGRGAARRGRQPDGRRAEEGRADRAADGREHRQGHVRCARRGLDRGRAGEGEPGPMRPLGPPSLPARRARSASGRRRSRLARACGAVRDAAAPRVPASVLRLPSRPGAGAGAAAERERRGGRGAARDV